MRRLLSLLAVVLTLGFTTVALDAEAAKRMGSGKSMGTQRQAAPDKATSSATPPAAAPGAAAAPAKTPSRSWMGPLAGIAAGLGLAALASHFGFGDELASMVMMGLLAAAVMVAIGFFMRRRAAQQQSAAGGAGGLQYAHASAGQAPQGMNAPAGLDAAAPAYKVAMPAADVRDSGGSMIGSRLQQGGEPAASIPAGFDAAGFEQNAKVNFVRLQAANDTANLVDISQFTTPAMFAELQRELTERGNAPQKTEVLYLDAKVQGVEENADAYLVSVRFTGTMRLGAGEPDESFDEIWHLEKARQGSGGWLLAGIQQNA
jgi:predicted lipid-binding transport protein (Tim44 family)